MATASIAPTNQRPNNKKPITTAYPEPLASASDRDEPPPRTDAEFSDVYDDSSDDDSDEMTDDAIEAEVDHGEEQIKWKQNKTWKKLKEKNKLTAMMEVERRDQTWTAPAKRDQVSSLHTGPEQEIYFHADGRRPGVELLLDALPVNKYWQPMVALSRVRAAAWLKVNQEDPRSTRRLALNWFTAENYMRVFAAIIMKGLVNVVDDPELCNGFANGKFKRTGATEVVGLTPNQ